MLANQPQYHQVGRRASSHSLTSDRDQNTMPRNVGVNVYQSPNFNQKEIARKSVAHVDGTRSYQAGPNKMGLTSTPMFTENSRTSINTATGSEQRSSHQASRQLQIGDDAVQYDADPYNIEIEIAQTALDNMMADVISARQETEKKQNALDQAEAELSSLRQTVHKLTTRLMEDGDTMRRKESEYLERIASANAEAREMQETHSQLNTEAEKWKIAAISKQRESETASSSSQALLQQHESLKLKLQELEGLVASKDAALSQSQAEKQQTEMQAYQLQNELAAMQQETQQQTALQKQHASLQDSHAAEVAEMWRMADHFKTASQKLSAANKQLTATNISFEESLQNMSRELKEKNNQIRALYDENAELQGRLGSR